MRFNFRLAGVFNFCAKAGTTRFRVYGLGVLNLERSSTAIQSTYPSALRLGEPELETESRKSLRHKVFVAPAKF